MKPLPLESFLGWAEDEDPITITKKELFEYFEAVLEMMEWQKDYGRIKKLREKCCKK